MRKPALVCLASAMTLLAVALHGAPGQKPIQQTAPKVASKMAVAPKYRLRVLFVRLADDDGSKASTLTKANAQAAIVAANTIFRANGGDVMFEMAPESDFSTVIRNTTMNHDCLLQPGWNETTIGSQTREDVNGDGSVDGGDYRAMCNDASVVAARNAYALLRPNRLVVYSRGGSEYVRWAKTHYVLKYASGGHSGENLLYVAMPHSFGGGPLLGHELGHYFHLPHTFGWDSYVAESRLDAAKKISDWVATHPNEDPLGCFDGDRRIVPAILDTPPDAGGTVLEEANGDKCDPVNGSVSFVVNVGGVQKTVQLTPDRHNIMSYFYSCQWSFHFSRNQYTIVDNSIAAGNRHPLTVGDPAERPCYEALHPERDSQKDALASLRDTLRKVANCHLLSRKPWRWELIANIYATPERATRTMVKDAAIARLYLDAGKERQLLAALSSGRSIIYEDER